MQRALRSLIPGLVLAAACGGGSKQAPVDKPAPPRAADDGSCPVAVPGTSVNVEDNADGAALVFVTTGDVAELRKRVRASHFAAMIATPSRSSTVDIEGGAKLQITAGGADVAKLQAELREHAKHLATGTCEMQHDMAHMDHDMDHPQTGHEHMDHDHPATDAAATAPPAADPKATALAVETAAFDKAKPVFDKWCAKCHTKGGSGATAKKLDHFDMTTYPFGGHHTATLGPTIRKVLAINGGKPTMPNDHKGAVKGDELALIAAWADAWDAAQQAGAHGEQGHGHDEHDHDHHH